MSRHVATTIARRPHANLFFSAPPAIRELTFSALGVRPGNAPSVDIGRSLWTAAARQYHHVGRNTAARWQGVGATSALGLGRAAQFQAGLVRTSRSDNDLGAIVRATARRRWKSDAVPRDKERPASQASKEAQSSHASDAGKDATQEGTVGKHLYDRLPHLHRPTKEELLSAATGFWHRLSLRFKWFSIRSGRPFNSEEIFAFISWIFWGHVLWLVIGTTTFVSLAIFAVNTVFAQETLAGWVGNYLTKSSGVKVVFESAVVPKWKSGVITFNNVFVSRRPGKSRQRAVSKGSSTEAAAAAASQLERSRDEVDAEEDTNYTQFDVTIDTVNVTLSFTKWFNGKGLLADVEVHGVRGVLDRTSVHSTGEYVDPKSYRHEHNTGDFEIDDFKMSDVLLTVYQPNNFRPFTASVFSCELPRLRKQWLFYDFLSATTMSGSFDDSLFTIHPVQAHGHTGVANSGVASLGDPNQWKKQSRLRIDGLNIDHLNRGVEGPFSWITEGNVDIVADLTIPHDEDESIAKVIGDFYDRMEATVSHVQTPFHKDPLRDPNIIDNREGYAATYSVPAAASPTQIESATAAANESPEANSRFLILDIRCHLNDVRATIPLFTKDLSYVNNALVRPIVAFINSKRAFIPVHCRVVKRQSEFDGSWTIFDSGLLDDLSRETYEAFSRDIADGERRGRRLKKVGLWTLQVAAQALFLGLVGQVA